MASYGPAVYPGTGPDTTYSGLFPGTGTLPGAAALSGPAMTPEDDLYPGSNTYPGQGNYPIIQVLYSTDDVGEATPTWRYVRHDGLRAFSVSRGRESELAEVDAGTATLVLDGRQREFDPVVHSGIRPMNRWWIRAQFDGQTFDVFKGYAESYDQQWPATVDAVTVVSCVDEFKVLALDKLPTMNPPRDSYADLVKSDEPAAYWRFRDFNLAGDPGPGWVLPSDGSFGITNTIQPILGEPLSSSAALQMTASAKLETEHSAFDTQSTGAVTVEFWFRRAGAPSSTDKFLRGRVNAANTVENLYFEVTTTGAVTFSANNTTPTLHTVSTGVLTVDTWFHIVGVISGSTIAIYVNGVQVDSDSWSGALATVSDDVSTIIFPTIQSTQGTTYYLDELAFYPSRNIGADRILAHYQGGTTRGFAEQRSALRIGAILDAAGSHAPRRMVPGVGVRDIAPLFMNGQSPLEASRHALSGEAVDAVFIAAKDGTLTFLDASHRTGTSYETVQMVFDDDGTDHPYLDLDLDYSDGFIVNEWNVTREGGVTQTASDATSIARYGKRSQSLSGLPVRLDSDALNIATALLGKYKDPMTRALAIRPKMSDPEVAAAVLALDFGDRIRIFRTPPGPGDTFGEGAFGGGIFGNNPRHDQTLWVREIEVSGAPGRPLDCKLGVSPV